MNRKKMSRQTRKKPQFHLKPVYAAVLLTVSIQTAQANPIGGTVTAGQASFSTSGNTLTVTNTPGTIINWQGFSIGSSEITRFAQQSASSTVLNRVVGSDPSSILGTLQSNGRVFLINPNGIMFGAGSIVDVAGLVASSLNLSDADFIAGRNHFTEVPGAANVSNAGSITAQEGGQIFLIAPNVENTGVITAPNGEILLAAGADVELVNTNDPNLRVSITAPAGDATNIGQLIASSGSLGLFGTLVSNSGAISADSATLEGGKIVLKASQRVDAGGAISASGTGGGTIDLLADMQSGTVNVTGTLDASAPVSGDGGYIDTSAAHVQVADTARITTAAANGLAGTWLIDPTDYTIALTGGDISGAALSTNLGSTNVIIQTQPTGGGNGDLFVNDAVSWSGNTTLSLNAIRNVEINAAITSGTASTASGNITIHSGIDGTGVGTVIFGAGGSVSMAGFTATTPIYGTADIFYNPISYIAPTNYNSNVLSPFTSYMLVNDVNQLQAINTNLAGAYSLSKNIDATVTSTWNSGQGFMPIGDAGTPFTGRFEGSGHTISNITINRIGTNIGLFGVIGANGAVRNVGLVNSSVTVIGAGNFYIGGLVGTNAGIISNSFTNNVTVSASNSNYVGGLVGVNKGSITNSHVEIGSVAGNSYVGGLVGDNEATVSNSYVVGNLTSGLSSVGGLVGANLGGVGGINPVSAPSLGFGLAGTNTNISNSYVNGGSVSGTNNIGGLVGLNSAGAGGNNFANYGYGGNGGAANVDHSYVANVNVTGSGNNVGGLVGLNSGGAGGNNYGNYGYGGGNGGAANISNTYAVGGLISGGTNVGGLVGQNLLGANGTVAGSGFVGVGGPANINLSYASNGSVTGTTVGGVVGYNNSNSPSSIVNAFWDTQTVGIAIPGIGLDSSGYGGAVGYNTVGMMTGTNYTGFDFSGTWFMIDGNTRPFLQMEWSDKITNPHQLQLMAMNPGANYTLAHNIDMVETGLTGMWSSAGFVPIGQLPGPAFTGNFDGFGHTISNLTINRPTESYGGLFGYSYGSISNVGLVNANITGDTDTGGLVGYNSGSINNSFVIGNVTGSSFVGGLVGYNYGAINDSHASISVTGTSFVGGLVGSNGGYVSTSSSLIIGGSISNSYVSSGNVTGTSFVGGLAGSYDDAAVITNSHYNVSGVLINTSTQVTAFGLYNPQYTDWFNGGLLTPLDIANYNASLVPTGGGNYTISNLQGMKDMLGFADNPTYSFNLNANIDLTPAAGYNVPYLASNFDGGSFTISNLGLGLPNDAIGLFGQIAPGSIVSNVSLSNVVINGNMGVGGLAGWNQGSINNSHVTGVVTGNSYVGGLVGYNDGGSILGSYVDALSTVSSPGDYVGGLVGGNYGGGSISNSYVDNVSVSGNGGVGGLIGFDGGEGSITNSYVNNSSVIGSGNNIGGLVGANYGSNINDTYVNGATVSGITNVGGLLGYNGGNISNSYASVGTVSGISNVGGLLGFNGGNISNSYASVGFGTVGTNFGGVVGYNDSFFGAISSNNFWDTTAGAGVTNSIGYDTNFYGGIINAAGVAYGMNASNMMTLANFNSATVANGNVNPGWDISNIGGSATVWRIYDGNTMPLLTSFLTPLTVTANDVSKTYDGLAFSGGNGVTYSVAGAGSSVSGTPIYAGSGTNAGSYSLAVSGLYSNQFGFDISYATGTLTIDPKVVTLSGTKVYDGSSTFTAGTNLSVSTGVGTETLGFAGTASTVDKNVGNTDLVGAGTLALADGTGLASNYTLTGVGLTGVISITPLALNGSIGAGSSVYGSALSAGTVTFSNLVGGDVLTAPTMSFNTTGNTSTSGNLNVGSYTSIQSVSALNGTDAANYSVGTFTDAGYTVSQLALTGTSIAGVSTVYGVSLPAGTVSFSNKIVGDDVTATATINSLLTDYSNGNLNIGSYTQTASALLTGADAGNYTFGGYTTPIANYTVVIPTVIDEIVNITDQNNEEPKPPVEETVAEGPTSNNGGDTPALPVCS